MESILPFALVLFLLALSLPFCKSGTVPNLTWPIRYFENVGSLLEQISCSTIFVLSFNAHYSHDIADTRTSNKVAFVQRIYFPRSTHLLFKLFDSRQFIPLKLPYNYSESPTILEPTNNMGKAKIFINSIKFPRMSCLHALLWSSQPDIKWKRNR